VTSCQSTPWTWLTDQQLLMAASRYSIGRLLLHYYIE
jgi:hypothetical protein